MEKSGVALLSIAAETVSSRNCDTPASLGDSAVSLKGAIHKIYKNSSSLNDSAVRPKLVLPELTLDVRKDLESGRLSSADLPLSISKRQEWLEYPLKNIAAPHPNDVLCGRGGGSNNHPGNEAFRVLVNEVKLPYVNCPKREKPLIARRVVEAVRNQSPPGRFLQKNGKTGSWDDIGDGRAREKTSQALREGASVIRNMADKESGSPDVQAKLKKTIRTSPGPMVVGQAEAEKKGVNCNEDLQRLKDAQMLAAKSMYEDCANQHQLLLSFQMKHGMQNSLSAVPLSNMYQPRGEQEYRSSKIPSQLASHSHLPSHEELGSGFAKSSIPFSQPHHRRRATVDHAPTFMRKVAPDSVPYEIVRGLLLGHLDPVHLAHKLLSPEDAATVERLHCVNRSIFNNNVCAQGQPSVNTITDTNHPLRLCSIVSHGSSSLSECQSMKEEIQLSDDSSRQSMKARRAVLPKKKRKFVE